MGAKCSASISNRPSPKIQGACATRMPPIRGIGLSASAFGLRVGSTRAAGAADARVSVERRAVAVTARKRMVTHRDSGDPAQPDRSRSRTMKRGCAGASSVPSASGCASMADRVHELCAPLELEKLREIGDTLRADLAHGRLALGALLGDRRIRIYRDGRIEGAVAVAAGELPAARSALGAGSLGGSGGALWPSRADRCRAALGGMKENRAQGRAPRSGAARLTSVRRPGYSSRGSGTAFEGRLGGRGADRAGGPRAPRRRAEPSPSLPSW